MPFGESKLKGLSASRTPGDPQRSALLDPYSVLQCELVAIELLFYSGSPSGFHKIRLRA
jgi:hypothetical protein